jgi:hypothetical protein
VTDRKLAESKVLSSVEVSKPRRENVSTSRYL